MKAHSLVAALAVLTALTAGCAKDGSGPSVSASPSMVASTTPTSPTPTGVKSPSISATPAQKSAAVTTTPPPPANVSMPAPVINGWKTSNLALGAGSIALSVQVEAALKEDANQFATRVVTTLNDTRGWAGLGKSFHLVDSPDSATIAVHLASPATVDARCAPLETEGYVSCSVGPNVWLNVNRWREAVPHIKDLETYRTYVISHEVGHSLGRGHVNCPGKGLPAPVMQQQTYGLQGCVANGWITVA